jgi:two-component system, cell cycle sensor histidine kinase and response regulator CckA
MKEQGAVITPAEPGVDWQRVTGFPAHDLLQSFRQLQERALKLELQNLELQTQQHGRLSPSESADVYDSARVGYIETDDGAFIQRINKIAANLLGGQPQQLTGKPLTDFFAVADASQLRDHLRRCGSGETAMSEEFVLQPHDREPIYVHAFCLPKAQREPVIRVALADITRVKEMEQKLLRLASFPAYNPNPVLEFSSDGTLVWFNESALDLAKYLGLNSPLQIAPPQAAQLAKDCFQTREARLRVETVIGDRHIYWSFFPVEAAGVVHCYGTDLTERVQVEQQLEQVRKLETVGHLASNVAHDFNNVLGIIQGYTCLILAQNALPAETAEALKQISTAAERATYLTRQLMTFSRKQAFQPKDFDLNDLVSRLSQTTRGLLGQNIHQELKLGQNLPRLHADPAMIEQILMNMTMNARDAMPRGGNLTISTSLAEVGSEASRRNPDARPGKFLCLTIADTGQGMDSETVSKIFEPFFTTKESGLGLGLSSVYGIVRQHHGWIEVQSEVGKGSVFKIFLPTMRVPYGAGKREVPAQPQPSGAETILVVEDEPALRELVSRQLRRQGYRVIQASTGREALGMWGEHEKDIALLFTDMVMPDGMTGSELAETLQAQKPGLKVVYTSGYSLEVLQQDFALRDDVHFLQKPYHQDALIRAVRAALDAKAPVNT